MPKKKPLTMAEAHARMGWLKANYELYENCRWHDPEARDEYIRLLKIIAETGKAEG